MLKKIHESLLRIVMRERKWDFNVNCDYIHFKNKIEKNITMVSPLSFCLFPFDYSKHVGIKGYLKNDVLKIKFVPNRLLLKGLFPINEGYIFTGKILCNEGKVVLSGSLQSYPLSRFSSLMFIYVCILVLCIYPILIMFSLSIYFNIELALSLMLQICISIFFVLFIYFGKKLKEYLHCEEINRIYAFLNGLC